MDEPEQTTAGIPNCGRKKKVCRHCGHRFPREEKELINCPECGEDRRCTLPGVGSGGACRFHGGASPQGVMHPNWRNGSRSKYSPFKRLPAKFQPIIEEVANDVLDLTDLAIVLKAHFYEVVSGAHQGESQELIRRALKRCEEMDAEQATLQRLGKEKAEAVKAGDQPRADALQAQIEKHSVAWNTAWEDVKTALRQDLDDWKRWEYAVQVAEKTTKVVESQRRGLVEAKLVLSIDRVEKVYGAMIEAVNDVVTDDDQIEKLQEKFRLIALQGLGNVATEIADGTAYEA